MVSQLEAFPEIILTLISSWL